MFYKHNLGLIFLEVMKKIESSGKSENVRFLSWIDLFNMFYSLNIQIISRDFYR